MEQKVQQFDTPPPNYSLRQHATHGFSHRPSLAQIAAYLIIIYTTVVYFTCIISIDPSPTLLSLFCVSLATLVISTAVATFTDPTDRVVYYYKWTRFDKKITFSPQYDKILYCQFCDSYCWSTAKHCRSCNRCVSVFDHHCMWFNNCVGKRNYKAFMASIISTFSFTVVVCIHVVVSSFKVDYQVREYLGKIVAAWVAALMMAIFGFLLFNLIVLHIYLVANEMTTYQFLQKRKKEEEEEKKKKQERQKQIQREKQRKELPPLVVPGRNKVMPAQSLPQLDSIDNIESKKIKFNQQPKLEEQVRSQHEDSHAKLDIHQQGQGQLKNSNTVFVGSDQASIRSKTEEKNEYLQERRQSAETEQEMMAMDRSLPRFFRENRSLKFLLANEEGQSPRKHHHQTEHFQLPPRE